MSNPFEDAFRRFSDNMPEPLRHLQADMEKNLRDGMEGMLHRMNLVTREEFDIQSAVLQRTRTKLDVLAQQVAELERICARTQPQSGETHTAADELPDPEARS
ncbi:MAG: accessory factor UbiK family protein [Thiothrix sp.]|nr:accessory factor UbiK family protein [Thiothrix sp.]HPQ94263.1 accessory factor UbiK family protein [Thiolinea sp.]